MASQHHKPTSTPTQLLYSTTPIARFSPDFRLLQLRCNEMLEKPNCTLRSYPIDGPHPTYIALSYTWGQDVRYDDIIVNGIYFPVGRNLWSFLNQMRFSNNFATFWIDAICIDQSQVFERNHQVQMMRKIYSQADSVSIWLGEEDSPGSSDSSDSAIETLSKWNTMLEVGKVEDYVWSCAQKESVLNLFEQMY
jgi:hypothetical protein